MDFSIIRRVMRVVFFSVVVGFYPQALYAATLVSFSPSTISTMTGSNFNVDLIAAVSDFGSDGVISWGLDLSYDAALLQLDHVAVDTAVWDGIAFGGDGDGLIGARDPGSAPISNQTVRLATLSFSVLGLGVDQLDVSANDPSLEGFFLNTGPGVQDPFTSNPADVTSAVPEPGNLLLSGILFGLLMMRARGRFGKA